MSEEAKGKAAGKPLPPQIQSFCGFCAGAISTVILHPLDLVKVRLQVMEENQRVLLRKQLPGIIKTEGYRGLYRGIGPNFAGATVSWGLYFFYYSAIKEFMADANDPTQKNLSPMQHLSASAIAGMLTALVANPLFVIKTRMFTQKLDDPSRYRGLFDGLRKLYSTEGVAGLYRGIVPALFGVSHGAIQFMAYEQLKIARKESSLPAPSALMGTAEYIGMAATSKIFAAICTYPYQVVKSRMQTDSRYLSKEYDGVVKTIKSVYRYEGLGGFYKGLGINIIRVLPGTCITFGSYELLVKFFKSRQ
ncbi:hypothetical protein HDV03_003853 [Kappamyces sp. JEL0829]|nr:hypothetical protein HDV03_003853 [Kappamyces sp. JEL0829]